MQPQLQTAPRVYMRATRTMARGCKYRHPRHGRGASPHDPRPTTHGGQPRCRTCSFPHSSKRARSFGRAACVGGATVKIPTIQRGKHPPPFKSLNTARPRPSTSPVRIFFFTLCLTPSLLPLLASPSIASPSLLPRPPRNTSLRHEALSTATSRRTLVQAALPAFSSARRSLFGPKAVCWQ